MTLGEKSSYIRAGCTRSGGRTYLCRSTGPCVSPLCRLREPRLNRRKYCPALLFHVKRSYSGNRSPPPLSPQWHRSWTSATTASTTTRTSCLRAVGPCGTEWNSAKSGQKTAAATAHPSHDTRGGCGKPTNASGPTRGLRLGRDPGLFARLRDLQHPNRGITMLCCRGLR